MPHQPNQAPQVLTAVANSKALGTAHSVAKSQTQVPDEWESLGAHAHFHAAG